jgi:hypothetical protein
MKKLKPPLFLSVLLWICPLLSVGQNVSQLPVITTPDLTLTDKLYLTDVEAVGAAKDKSVLLSQLITLFGPTITVPAANLTGILPDARFPATLPALNGSNLTALNAAQITSGFMANERLDADLAAIAALTTTSYGRSLLSTADAAGLRTLAGLGSLATQNGTIADYLTTATAASSYQPLDADLTSMAALTTTSYGRSLLAAADAAGLRTLAGLGTLATQNGSFSGSSSGTNTGDQNLSAYLTTANAATTYAPLSALTGGGVVATGGFTLTVPATGTAALTSAANTFNLAQTITATTAATSSSTGALIVSGGIGAAKDSFFGFVGIGGGSNAVISNTAVGNEALIGSHTATNSVAVGTNALTSLDGADSNNTAVGFEALGAATNSRNTAVGASAGRFLANGTTALTNSTDSVYIGHSARGSSTGETNAIVIGSTAVGSGSNSTVIGKLGATTNTYLYGTVWTQASFSARAGLNIAQGSAPGSPNTGDVWLTAEGLFVRVGSSTVGPLAQGPPSGIVVTYEGPTPPAGWLFCDGSAVSRSTYGTLFALLTGTVGGTIDGDELTMYLDSPVANSFVNGARIEGPGIPEGTTIYIVDQSTLTLSNNCTPTPGSPDVFTILRYGAPNSTEFSLPTVSRCIIKF